MIISRKTLSQESLKRAVIHPAVTCQPSMARLYVGGLDPATTERDLEDEFTRFGTLRTVSSL